MREREICESACSARCRSLAKVCIIFLRIITLVSLSLYYLDVPCYVAICCDRIAANTEVLQLHIIHSYLATQNP